jgi:hypothetical protein
VSAWDFDQLRKQLAAAEARVKRAETALREIAEKAQFAKTVAAAPDYDEEAIRDALWAVVAAAPLLEKQR